MDTETVLSNPDIEDTSLVIAKAARDIKRGIKQNFKYLQLVNPFFSCKSEAEYAAYLKKMHILLDETITMRLALFTRSRKKGK